MTHRLEKGLCLWCGGVLIAIEKALCSGCTKKYHEKMRHLSESTKREKLSGERRSSKRLKFPKGIP